LCDVDILGIIDFGVLRQKILMNIKHRLLWTCL
jgi:hypothetical protein